VRDRLNVQPRAGVLAQFLEEGAGLLPEDGSSLLAGFDMMIGIGRPLSAL
jgi:hypothetical protein